MTLRQSATVVHSGFSTRTWSPDVEHVVEDLDVGHVGASDHHGIAQTGGQQVAVVHEHRRMRCAHPFRLADCRRRRRLVRVAHRSDHGTGQRGQVAQVLETHHAHPDDPVSDGRRSGVEVVTGAEGTGARPAANRRVSASRPARGRNTGFAVDRDGRR